MKKKRKEKEADEEEEEGEGSRWKRKRRFPLHKPYPVLGLCSLYSKKQHPYRLQLCTYYFIRSAHIHACGPLRDLHSVSNSFFSIKLLQLKRKYFFASITSATK